MVRRHPALPSALALALGLLLSTVLALVPGIGAAPAAAADTYSATVQQAVAALPGAAERRTGYDRDLFPHWVDADGDGCDTRREVLISEADDPVGVGAGCALSGGRWFSFYDRVSVTGSTGVDIDHMVPLAEAWDSGAHAWSAADRRAFANDLGDARSLVGVTASSNRSKGDQDPAEWLPAYDTCRYLREWVAVKHRWRLTVDPAERSALTSLASGCAATTITVTRAR